MGAESAEVAAESSSAQSESHPPEDVLESMDLTIPAANKSELNAPDSLMCNSTDELYKLGFGLNDLYKLSLQFYRREKDELPMSYTDKVRLVALWKQVIAGRFSQSKSPEVGYFDVIGNDRKKAWEALGDMAPDVAKQQFCDVLEGNCPAFVNFVAGKRAEIDAELERKQREEEEQIRLEIVERERKRREAEETLRLEEEERLRKEEEERFRKEEEEERIQREEERIRKEEEEKVREATIGASVAAVKYTADTVPLEPNAMETIDGHVVGSVAVPEAIIPPANSETPADIPLAPASLWTRPKLEEFINHVKGDASSVLVVGRGETVTVRVPTHDKGSCLFWEFATDYYDVGFGVYFEWSTAKSSVISVNINESDNDDTPENIMNESNKTDEQIETEDENIVVVQKPKTDEVLPVLRRNSHEQVIVGSHMYPGCGTYLLKFDNSYSLLRSKTLYYRVYYTK